MYVIKDEVSHFEEKFAKIIHIFLSKRSDPDLDPMQLSRIQKIPGIQHGKKGQ